MPNLTKFFIFLLLSFAFGTLAANVMDDSPHYAPKTITCKVDGDGYFNCDIDSPYFDVAVPWFDDGVYTFTEADRPKYDGSGPIQYVYAGSRGRVILEIGYSMIDIDKNAPGNQWKSDKYGDTCRPAQGGDVMACPFTHTPYTKTK